MMLISYAYENEAECIEALKQKIAGGAVTAEEAEFSDGRVSIMRLALCSYLSALGMPWAQEAAARLMFNPETAANALRAALRAAGARP